ncbi:GNAT family N-acetyltransferase [Actibacterium mucosum]|nr:GNAT family N-acetyltransferase [Actibacterium mucosum]
MFPITNLRQFGLSGQADRAMRVWLHKVDGRILNMLAITNEGMLMPQMPHEAPELLQEASALLQGRKLIGCLGEALQVRALLGALSLQDVPCNLNTDEPGFVLPLDQMTMPQTDGFHVETLTERHRELTTEWRRAYCIEILGTQPDQAMAEATRNVEGFIAGGKHVVLFHNGQPVAMSGFNAALPDVVQIGAVFTPQPLRGRGYARRAVALHLKDARNEGVKHAVLFAASDQAAAAYRAIGFTRNGTYALVLFTDAHKVPICP